MQNSKRDTEYTRYKESRISAIHTESGCEYILPDYKGQIKKLLLFTAKPIEAGKYESEQGCSCSGIVEYKMLYYDANGDLTSLEFTSDYDFEVRCGAPIADSYVTTKVAASSVRVLGPRKISVKCTLCSDVFVKTEDILPSLPDADKYECRNTAATIHRVEYCIGAEREYAEEGELIEGFGCDDLEIVSHDARVRVNEVNVREGEIDVRGDITINAIVRVNGGECAMSVCRIPFDESIVRESSAQILHASATGHVCSLSSGVNDKTDSEGDHVGSAPVFSVSMELAVRLDYSDEVDMISDVYSPVGECRSDSVEYTYYEPIASGVKREKLAFNITAPEPSCLPKAILGVSSCAKSLSYAVEDKCIKITGECESAVIVSSIGDEPYSVIKGNEPFEILIPLGKNTELKDAQIVANVSVSDNAAVISEGAIGVELWLDCDVLLLDKKCVSTVTEALVTTDSEVRGSSCVRVYYPDDSESLWDICKRFCAPIKAVVKENLLPDEASVDPWNLKWTQNREFLVISEF